MVMLTNILTIKNIVLYVLIINLIAFFAMWIDKQKAKKGKWRIKEGTLFTLVLLGGGIGGILGMYTFRHKTKKMYFTLGFPVILVIEIVLIIMLYIKF